MGIAYSCKPNRKLAMVVWDGQVTWDVWREHLLRMLVDPHYAPMQSQITDLRSSSLGADILNDQIELMIDLVAGQRSKL